MIARPRTPDGVEGLDALLARPGEALVAFDYDGTLAPIVDDPATAVAHHDAAEVLAVLSAHVGAVAIITGRPPQLALRLGGFDRPGLERLTIAGHYGGQLWTPDGGEITVIEPPPGLAAVRERVPKIVEALDIPGMDIEDKGLAIAVHVRGTVDPERSQRYLLPPLAAAAQRWDLVVEQGRSVIELRAPGIDKGKALRQLVRKHRSRVVVVFGDDLGDLAAFDQVEVLRAEGLYGLVVCSGSDEVRDLADRSDLVVDGPDGVIALVRELVEAISDR